MFFQIQNLVAPTMCTVLLTAFAVSVNTDGVLEISLSIKLIHTGKTNLNVKKEGYLALLITHNFFILSLLFTTVPFV